MTSCPCVEIKALAQLHQAEEQKIQILFLNFVSMTPTAAAVYTTVE